MDYKNKVKIENTLKESLASNEFTYGGIVDDLIANKQRTYSVLAIKGGANPLIIKGNTYPTSGMIIDFLPSLGGRTGIKRFQLAFKDQFVKVVGSAYSSLALNEVDLIKLAMYSEGSYLIIAEIDRALQVYDKFDKVNAAFGQFLVEMMGFSWADLSQNRTEWVDNRNILAHIVNDKFYLGKSERLTRHLTLASKVYATDTNRKSQLIVFRPLEYATLGNLTSWEVGIRNSFSTITNGGVAKNISLTGLKTYINEVRDASMSAWYDDVAPYLHHLYGDSDTDLYKVSDYAALNDFAICYDADINVLIKNMRLIQAIYLDAARTNLDTHLWITESNQGYARQGGWDGSSYTNAAEAMVAVADATLTVGGQTDAIDILYLDSYNVEEFPADKNEIFCALLGRFEEVSYAPAPGVLVPGVINNAPTTLFYSARYVDMDESSNGSITGTSNIKNNVINVLGGALTSTVRGTSASPVPLLTKLCEDLQFGVHPYSIVLDYDSGSGDVNGRMVHCDLDNEFVVGITAFESFVNAEVYANTRFNVPSFTSRK